MIFENKNSDLKYQYRWIARGCLRECR